MPESTHKLRDFDPDRTPLSDSKQPDEISSDRPLASPLSWSVDCSDSENPYDAPLIGGKRAIRLLPPLDEPNAAHSPFNFPQPRFPQHPFPQHPFPEHRGTKCTEPAEPRQIDPLFAVMKSIERRFRAMEAELSDRERDLTLTLQRRLQECATAQLTAIAEGRAEGHTKGYQDGKGQALMLLAPLLGERLNLYEELEPLVLSVIQELVDASTPEEISPPLLGPLIMRAIRSIAPQSSVTLTVHPMHEELVTSLTAGGHPGLEIQLSAYHPGESAMICTGGAEFVIDVPEHLRLLLHAIQEHRRLDQSTHGASASELPSEARS